MRAGKEPQNQGTTEHPPSPPEGGPRPAQVVIEELYVTDRGRKRARLVCVDLDAVRRGLRTPTSTDEDDWRRMRALMRASVGESVFEIWLDPLQLIGVDDDGAVVVTAPVQMLAWLRSRWGELITGCGDQAGRAIRFADEKERVAIADATMPAASGICGTAANNGRGVVTVATMRGSADADRMRSRRPCCSGLAPQRGPRSGTDVDMARSPAAACRTHPIPRR